MEQKKKTLNVLFLMRKSHQNEVEASLFCRITIRGQRYEIPLNSTIKAKNWNKDAQRSVGKFEADKLANRAIEDCKVHVSETLKKMHERGYEINISNFKLLHQSTENEYNTLLRMFDYHEIIDCKNLAEGTSRGYIVTRKHLANYIRIKYHVADYNITAIDKAFVSEFFAYLQGYRREGKIKCAVNSALKHMQRLGRVLNLAIQNDWITRNPVDQLHVHKTKVEKEFLTESEVKAIERATLKPHLTIVRDLFLFAVYTGISFVDIQNLTNANINIGIDRSLWLHYNRQKTETRCAVPLLEPAETIYHRYEAYHDNRPDNHIFPVPPNQVVNRYLKQIATAAGVEKRITFHMARHTFATTITLCHHIPIETVSKMLGHASLATTQIYAKVLDNKIMDDMAELKKLYSTKEKEKKSSNNNKAI